MNDYYSQPFALVLHALNMLNLNALKLACTKMLNINALKPETAASNNKEVRSH